jgi:O-antigen/teichoic acid export membrane protein
LRDRVRHLTKGVAIYGAGDAAVQIVNFLLLPVYVKGGFLAQADYGALALIIAIESVAKVISRLGLDGAFMRYYHDHASDGTLPRLTSTIVWFLLALDVVLFGAAIAAAGWVGPALFDDAKYVSALRFMLVNTALMSVTFVPFHLMRMQNRAATYSGLVLTRSAGTLLLRIVFVIGLGRGVAGMYQADLAMTLLLLPLLWRWFRPVLAAMFSFDDLRATLRFALPRVPHGLAQQALEAGNKALLSRYIPLERLGVYQNGVTLGTGVRFFSSAFETAWAPFYYETARQPDAKEVFRRMTTYALAAITLIVAVTIAVAHDAILVMLSPEWIEASRVIPFIAIGLGLQGVYLLTSIGLNLTKRTEFYPVATFSALAVGLGLGAWLMRDYGIVGAAVAFMLSYATQATVAYVLARRLYPIPYETGRIARVVAGGALAALAGTWAVPEIPPLAGLVLRALVASGVFAAWLAATGFFRATERAFALEMIARLRRRPAARVERADGG